MKVIELLKLLKEGGVSHLTIGFMGNEGVTVTSDATSFVADPIAATEVVAGSVMEEIAEVLSKEQKPEVPPKVQEKPAAVSEATPQPKAAPKVAPKVAPKAVAEPAPTKSVFDQFIDATTKDAGEPDAAQIRADLIKRMSRDELLRVNIEFSGGIDTDQPDAGLRQAILEMF